MKRFLKISSYAAFILALGIVGGVSIPSSLALMKPQVAHADGLGSLVSSSESSLSAAVSNAVAPLISTSPAAATTPAPATSVTPAATVTATTPVASPSVSTAPVTVQTAAPVTTSTKKSKKSKATASETFATDQTASAASASKLDSATFSQKALSAAASIAGLSGSSAAAAKATSTPASASSTITMGAAAIINDTFGSPALVQAGTAANPQSIYTIRTTLPLHQTLAWLCLSLALFVIGIICIRRDKMPFGSYSISPTFTRNPATIR